jgi:hypothetical protein
MRAALSRASRERAGGSIETRIRLRHRVHRPRKELSYTDMFVDIKVSQQTLPNVHITPENEYTVKACGKEITIGMSSSVNLITVSVF